MDRRFKFHFKLYFLIDWMLCWPISIGFANNGGLWWTYGLFMVYKSPPTELVGRPAEGVVVLSLFSRPNLDGIPKYRQPHLDIRTVDA